MCDMKCFWQLSLLLTLVACGRPKDQTDQFDINVSKVEEKPLIQTKEVIDLANKGVGPVKEVILVDEIDEPLSKQGEELFNTYCTTCHRINEVFVGPALSGVTKRRSPEWIMNMILNPGRMVQQDSLAKAVFMEYNGSPMTNLGFEEKEARAVLEYLRSQ